MNEKKLKITIQTNGDFTIETVAGFEGTSCLKEVEKLTVGLTYDPSGEGVTDAFYDGKEGDVFLTR